MPTEMEFVNYKEFVETLPEATEYAPSDKAVISNATNGPRQMPENTAEKIQAQKTLVGGVAPGFKTTKKYVNRKVVSYDGRVYRYSKDHPAGNMDASEVSEYILSEAVESVCENALAFALNGDESKQKRIFGLDPSRYYRIISKDSWNKSSQDLPIYSTFELAYTTDGVNFVQVYNTTDAVNGVDIRFRPNASALFYTVYIRNGEGNFVNFVIEPEQLNYLSCAVKSSNNVSSQDRIYLPASEGVVTLKIDVDVPSDYEYSSNDLLEISLHKRSTNSFVNIRQFTNFANVPKNLSFEINSDIDFVNLWLRSNDEVNVAGEVNNAPQAIDISATPIFLDGLYCHRNYGWDVTSSLNSSCSPVYCKGAAAVKVSLDVPNGSTDAGICFYDDKMQFISGYASSETANPTTIKDYLVQVPNGAVYFRTSIYTTTVNQFKCVLYFHNPENFSLYKKDENVMVGIPQLYLSDATSATQQSLNSVHTSELYDEYDALVTAYPDIFTRQADLGEVTRVDDSEVFTIRSYRLDFTKKAMFDHEPSDIEVVTASNNLYAKYNGKPRKILVNGGMHGEEKTPCWGLMLSIKSILESSDPWATFIKNNFVLEIIPCLNPAGWDMCRRGNCNNKVLNRDEAINEPETLMYMDWIEANKDAFILIDVHGTQGRFAYAPVNRAEPIFDQVIKATLQLSTFFYSSWKSFYDAQSAGYGTTYAPFLLAKYSPMQEAMWGQGRLNCRMFKECGMQEFAIETPDNLYNGSISTNDLRNCKITKDLFINYLQFVCGAEKIRM